MIKPSNIPLSDQLENIQLDLEEAVTSGYPKVVIDNLRRQNKVLSEALDLLNYPNAPRQTLKEAVCEAFGIEARELFTRTRLRKVVNARQVYIYILINTLDLPGYNKKNGKGCKYLERKTGINYTTVIHSVEVVSNFIDTEAKYKIIVADLIKGVRAGYFTVDEFSELKIK